MKVFDLLNKNQAEKFLQTEIIDIFYGGQEIKGLRVFPIKESRKEKRWHLVCIFKLQLTKEKLSLFFTGHSNGSRELTFKKQKYLYDHGFDQGKYQVPRVLKYFPELKGMFYQAVAGQNMLSAIRLKSPKIKNAMLDTAGWVAKLHNLKPATEHKLFQLNELNMKSFDPADNLPKIKKRLPKFHSLVQSLVKEIIIAVKKHQVDQAPKLTHGDLHPENTLVWQNSVMVIDYTDLNLGDSAYDLGSFIQQFGFMAKDIYLQPSLKIFKQLFLQHYQKVTKQEFNTNFVSRINYYQAWLALKGACFFFVINREDKMQYLQYQALEIIDQIKKQPNKIVL